MDNMRLGHVGPPMISALEPRRAAFGSGRVVWVDAAKGICIVLVVIMHATLSVEAEMGRTGFMHWAVAFSKPFRIPSFFLIAGLFLSRVIDRDWRSYADKRVMHFIYFYVLWLLIQSAFKVSQVSGGSTIGFVGHLALALVEPYSTLWFIYALAVFSVVTKLTRIISPLIVLGASAALQVAPIETGFLLVDEFCERWFFFVAGYLFAGHVFGLADWTIRHVGLALGIITLWAVLNGAFALTTIKLGHSTTLAELPGIGLAVGLAGAGAIVVAAAIMARRGVALPFRYAGSRSLEIYLTFFLPMALSRAILIKSELIHDPGVVAAIVSALAVTFPLLLEALVRNTRLKFLYRRPTWTHLPLQKKANGPSTF